MCTEEQAVGCFTPISPVCNGCRVTRHKELRTASETVVAKDILTYAKRRAKANDLPFSLELKDILPLPTVCPILKIPICFDASNTNKHQSPSLDRITPVLGYVPGNVRVVSNRANMLKNNATPEETRLIYLDSLAILRNQQAYTQS